MIPALLFAPLLSQAGMPVYGSILQVSGVVYRRVGGARSRVDRRSVGVVLRIGDSVKVERGGLVVRTGKGTRVFWPKKDWQPILRPPTAKEQEAYAAVQRAFDLAGIRRGAATFPNERRVPCRLFTLVGPGPYGVAAGSLDLYGSPHPDRAELVRRLVEARDVHHATEVQVTFGSALVDVPLMPLGEEDALLRELDGARGPLARALVFARHDQFEFARYELDRLPPAEWPPLSGKALLVPPVKPAL